MSQDRFRLAAAVLLALLGSLILPDLAGNAGMQRTSSPGPPPPEERGPDLFAEARAQLVWYERPVGRFRGEHRGFAADHGARPQDRDVVFLAAGEFPLDRAALPLPAELRSPLDLEKLGPAGAGEAGSAEPGPRAYFLALLSEEAPAGGDIERPIASIGPSVRFLWHQPHAAVALRAEPRDFSALRTAPFFERVHPYHPGLKIDAMIGRRPFRNRERAESPVYRLDVILFPGEDRGEMDREVRRLGGVVQHAITVGKLTFLKVDLPHDRVEVRVYDAQDGGEIAMTATCDTTVAGGAASCDPGDPLVVTFGRPAQQGNLLGFDLVGALKANLASPVITASCLASGFGGAVPVGDPVVLTEPAPFTPPAKTAGYYLVAHHQIVPMGPAPAGLSRDAAGNRVPRLVESVCP